MTEGKNVSASFCVSPRFKCLLAAAAQEQRSQTNMVETLLFAYCEEQGFRASPAKKTESKTHAEEFFK